MMRVLLLLFALIANPNKAFSQYENSQKMVSVTVRYDQATATDTLMLFVMNPLYGETPSLKNPGKKIKATMDNEGLYKFSFKTNTDIGYYMVANLNPKEGRIYTEERFVKRARYLKKALTPLLIYESGDNVKIQISKKKVLPTYETYDPIQLFDLSFSGEGATKLRVWTETYYIYRKIGGSNKSFDSNHKYQDGYAKSAEAIKTYIEDHKDAMSPEAYELLMADALYKLYTPALKNGILRYYKEAEEQLSSEELENIKKAYFENVRDVLPETDLSKETLAISYYYFRYLVRKNIVDSYFLNGSEDPSQVFERIMSKYSGELRERMLTLFLYTSFGTRQFDKQLEKVIKIARTDYCQNMLTELKKRKTGREMVNFELEDQKGNIVSLSEFRGKVIVIDFWFTGCGACKWMFENVLKKAEEVYQYNPSVKFISISVDGSRRVWENSLKKGGYTSDKAINLFTNGEGMSHPIVSSYNIRAYPTIVIINKEGKIDSYDLSDIRKEDGFKALSNQIDKLL